MTEANGRSLELDAADSLYAATYDSMSIHWDGELDAYVRWARAAAGDATPRVLELACGTGRVAIPLAEAGCEVWGVDISPTFLKIAQSNGPEGNPRWFLGDMRTVELRVQVDFGLIAAQSFGFMVSAEDQLAALRVLHRHVRPGGRIALHVEIMEYAYLAGLSSEPPPPRDPRDAAPLSAVDGTEWRPLGSASLDRLAEVVTFRTQWVRMSHDQEVERRVPDPIDFKVLGVVEVEHALGRAGYTILERQEWQGTSSTPNGRQLVWLAERAG